MPVFHYARYAVPAEPEPLPAGFNVVRQPLVAGLPQTIKLDGDLSLVCLLPTGLAKTWRELDPDAIVSTSSDQLRPVDEPATDPVKSPARLLLLDHGRTAASLPLIAGTRELVPVDGSDGGVRLEVVVLSWRITAGAVRSLGDTAAEIEIAWRRADQSGPFETGGSATSVMLPAEFRMESQAEPARAEAGGAVIRRQEP